MDNVISIKVLAYVAGYHKAGHCSTWNMIGQWELMTREDQGQAMATIRACRCPSCRTRRR